MQLFFLNVYYVLQYCDGMEKKATKKLVVKKKSNKLCTMQFSKN
jgi:hypothetical protein